MRGRVESLLVAVKLPVLAEGLRQLPVCLEPFPGPFLKNCIGLCIFMSRTLISAGPKSRRSRSCTAWICPQCSRNLHTTLARRRDKTSSFHQLRGAAERQRIDSPRTVVFSGIQPTGVPHLGNYLGALREWVRLQNAHPSWHKLYFSIVDLHSLTSRSQNPAGRRQAKKLTLASLLASGLDPARSTIFFQSQVRQHAELHWILSCGAGMGSLARLTQWKSKLSEDTVASLLQPSANPKSEERLKLGLFSYPVLQAADILLYRATHVPVGEDQIQHLEFARAIAEGFNRTSGAREATGSSEKREKPHPILQPPQALVGPSRRIMSLLEPEKKMSKSHENEKSRILISDKEEVVRKKCRSALTDSQDGVTYDPQHRPGVANLLEIISNLDSGERSPEEVAQEFQAMQVQGSVMRVLKDRAAEVVNRELGPVREKLESLISINESTGHLDAVAHQGKHEAEQMAESTMRNVRYAVGLTDDAGVIEQLEYSDLS